ncbi:MAG: nucleotide pyrophosphohydrolase [Ketobacteraceae bacterium]|nr:nucleotide pyrophosphohydrolase [Ketobacteraceae bacterium]
MDLEKIRQGFGFLADDQKWRHFHSPKNLSMALMVEVGELLEHFQWLDEAQSRDLKNNPEQKALVADEMADVLMYLVALADRLEVNLEHAVEHKMEKLLKRLRSADE